MRAFIIIIFITISYSSIGQTGRKILNFFGYISEPKIENRQIIVYKNDTTVKTYIYIGEEQLHTENNLKYYWYYNDKINSNIGGFAGELLDREYLAYNRNDKLVEKGNFNKGLKTGEWKKWGDNGNLISITNWNNGIIEGEYFEYYPNGKIKIEASYKKNMLEGDYIYHDYDTIIVRKYKNGKEFVIQKPEKPDKTTKKPKDKEEKNMNLFKSKKEEEKIEDLEEIDE